MAIPLTIDNLQTIRANGNVAVPAYDVRKVQTGIVHFGPSNFMRAHLAVYADDLLARGFNDCGIVAISPKVDEATNGDESRTLRRQRILNAQDSLYTVLERDANVERLRVIGSIRDLKIGPQSYNDVVELMCQESVRLVTMTVTQNGYYYSPKNKGLDLEHPDVKNSMANAEAPVVTVAYIVKALELRRERGMKAFTVMSCDNMESNSDKLRHTVLAYAGAHDRKLRDWIADNVPFLNTMVDRITPNPDPKLADYVADKYGVTDGWPLATEPFKQLAIETKHQRPDLPIPPFEIAGAMMVKDVAPTELAKLRLLNGAHMALGVMGRLLGETHADTALRRPEIRAFVQMFMDEAEQTLRHDSGMDLKTYRKVLLDRMANPYIHDELTRLARNGSEKVKTRFLSPLRDAYAHGTEREYIMYALASWVRYVAHANDDKSMKSDHNGSYFVDDPKAYDTGLIEMARDLGDDATALLSIQGLWDGMENNPQFVKEFRLAYEQVSGYHPVPAGLDRQPKP